MERFIGQYPKVVVPITHIRIERNCLYIPKEFVLKFCRELKSIVYICIKNGDMFKCVYNADLLCIIGIQSIVKRYELASYSYFILEYVGESTFSMAVINCYAIEIEYPASGENVVCCISQDYKPMAANIRRRTEGVDNNKGLSIADRLNASCLRFNSVGGFGKCIQLDFCNEEVLSLQNNKCIGTVEALVGHNFQSGNVVTLKSLGVEWPVKVVKLERQWYFSDGWLEFTREAPINEGDYLILKRVGGANVYEVLLFRNYRDIGKSIRRGRGHYRPAFFIHQIVRALFKPYKIVIPRIFIEKYRFVLPKFVSIRLENTDKVFTVGYDEETHTLFGLKSLLRAAECTFGDMFIFKYLRGGVFLMSVYTFLSK